MQCPFAYNGSFLLQFLFCSPSLSTFLLAFLYSSNSLTLLRLTLALDSSLFVPRSHSPSLSFHSKNQKQMHDQNCRIHFSNVLHTVICVCIWRAPRPQLAFIHIDSFLVSRTLRTLTVCSSCTKID